MKRRLHILFTLVIIMVTVNFSFGQTTYFVDISQPDDSGDGTSWATAKKNLQTAIDLTSAGDEVRVAYGMYIPNEFPNSVNVGNPRHRTFHINKDIILKGSFNPVTNTQDLNNPTILSGDFNDDDVIAGSGETLSITNNSENAYHVIITADLTEAAVIDGFTVQGGNATGTAGPISFSGESIYRDSGGGMFNSENSSPSISNMTFIGNTAEEGGGMFNNGNFNTISFTITTSTFIQNLATNVGGGMRNNAQFNISLDNLSFIGNKANYRGGGLASRMSIISLTNSMFDANVGSFGGGGIYDKGVAAESIIKNCVFRDNIANGYGDTWDGSGGAILAESGQPAAIIGCGFFRNRAAGLTGDGGAILIYPGQGSNDHVDFINNIFADNHAEHHGGALYYIEPGSTNFVNNVFARNTVVTFGAASVIFIDNSSNPTATTITNCTFFGNRLMNTSATNTIRANAAPFKTVNSRLTFNNNVFYNNPGIEIDVPYTTVRRNNFAENYTDTGFTTLTSNPFINSSNPEGADNIFGTLDDGLFPSVNSPLIDAGSNTRLPFDTRDMDNDNDTAERLPSDITGMQRIVQISSENNVDVGAYEYNSTLSTNDNVLNSKWILYPNPAKDKIILLNEQNLNFENVEIYDITGRLIQTNSIKNSPNQIILDTSTLNSGNYLLIISSDKGRVSKKLIKK